MCFVAAVAAMPISMPDYRHIWRCGMATVMHVCECVSVKFYYTSAPMCMKTLSPFPPADIVESSSDSFRCYYLIIFSMYVNVSRCDMLLFSLVFAISIRLFTRTHPCHICLLLLV